MLVYSIPEIKSYNNIKSRFFKSRSLNVSLWRPHYCSLAHSPSDISDSLLPILFISARTLFYCPLFPLSSLNSLLHFSKMKAHVTVLSNDAMIDASLCFNFSNFILDKLLQVHDENDGKLILRSIINVFVHIFPSIM